MRARHRWLAGTLLAVVLAVVSCSGLVGADRLPGLAQLAAFRPQLAGLGVVAVALLARPLRVAVLPLLLVVVVSLGGLVPRAVASASAGTAAATLTVLTVSTARDRADPGAIVRLVAEHDVDVLALPEASTGYARRVAGEARMRAGTSGLLGAGPGTALLVRDGLEVRPAEELLGLANGTVAGTVVVGGVAVTLHAVHPTSPLPLDEATWSDDLAVLAGPCAAAEPTIVVGDLNASPDHSGFRALLEAGCRDVGAAAGGALVGTWPQAVPRALGTVIDHVLLAGPRLAPLSYEVLDAPGSDHRAVLAVVGVG